MFQLGREGRAHQLPFPDADPKRQGGGTACPGPAEAFEDAVFVA